MQDWHVANLGGGGVFIYVETESPLCITLFIFIIMLCGTDNIS